MKLETIDLVDLKTIKLSYLSTLKHTRLLSVGVGLYT